MKEGEKKEERNKKQKTRKGGKKRRQEERKEKGGEVEKEIDGRRRGTRGLAKGKRERGPGHNITEEPAEWDITAVITSNNYTEPFITPPSASLYRGGRLLLSHT